MQAFHTTQGMYVGFLVSQDDSTVTIEPLEGGKVVLSRTNLYAITAA